MVVDIECCEIIRYFLNITEECPLYDLSYLSADAKITEAGVLNKFGPAEFLV